MKRSSALAAVIAIAATMVAAMAALSMRSARQSADNEDSVLAKSDRTRRELGQLRAELSAVRHRVQEVEQVAARAPAAAGDSVAEVAPAKNGSSASASKLSPKEHDELLVHLSKRLLDERLREEPRDASWARAKEREIEAAFAERYSSRLVSVTCGSTLCRTVVDHGKDEERKRFLETLFTDSTIGGSCWFMRMGEGVGTELYCAREGEQLPRVDPERLR